MARSRRSAKEAGAKFETLVAVYLAVMIDDRIERRRLNGSNDRGDIGSVRHMGQRVTVECKDYAGSIDAGPWLNEVDIERGNDDAGVGIVVAKRRGYGKPGDQIVLMTLRDLVSLMNGERPNDD